MAAPARPQAKSSQASDTPNQVRMLVLETDEPHPDTQREKGGFGDVLNELLVQAGNEHDPKLGIETVMQYTVAPDGGSVPTAHDLPRDIHAILITGSEWDAHGDDAWILELIALIQEVWRTRPDVRFTGICFGHQVLCRALGSTVAPEPHGEWELAHSPVILSDAGRRLFNLRAGDDRIHLHQMHHDHVVNPPSCATTDLLPRGTKVHVWGTSEHTGVQGVYVHTRLFTMQGHMEFTERMVKRQLAMRVAKGSVSREAASAAAERAHWMHDGLVVAQAVLRFFHGDDDDIV